jgi:hypothetical protein
VTFTNYGGSSGSTCGAQFQITFDKPDEIMSPGAAEASSTLSANSHNGSSRPTLGEARPTRTNESDTTDEEWQMFRLLSVIAPTSLSQPNHPTSKLRCHICHRTFVRPAHLDDHLNAHMGLKPHRCEGKCGNQNWYAVFVVVSWR